jgi:uncharacterized protein (DUF2237 family)
MGDFIMYEKMNSVNVSISKGNTKMGYVPSVSLPPIVTCAKNCTCAKKCYAAKLCKLRPTVRNAYQRNLDILSECPADYWRQVEAAVMMSRFFRFHVSGDIVNADYFNHMVDIASRNAHCNILAFTKRYDIVNAWIAENGMIPENLKIIFSAWPGMEMANPYNMPVANVIFKGMTPADNWKICGGNCMECASCGIGCWELKPGEHIAFHEH